MAGDMRRDVQARDPEHGENGDMQDIADVFGGKKAHEILLCFYASGVKRSSVATNSPEMRKASQRSSVRANADSLREPC
jgi:hypothetical protein